MAGAKKPEREHQFWWEMLPAIPAQRGSIAYERLKRVWFDHTWSGHPFLKPGHENHLTATLFENFIFFRPESWLHEMLKAARIVNDVSPFLECAWGYEVLADGKKLADVAIHARDAQCHGAARIGDQRASRGKDDELENGVEASCGEF